IQNDILLPTFVTERYVGSARLIVEGDEVNQSHNESKLVRPERFRSTEDILRSLQPSLEQMWLAAWDVLEREAPDAVRMAAHEARELLSQTLDYLAPKNVFTKEELEQKGSNG